MCVTPNMGDGGMEVSEGPPPCKGAPRQLLGCLRAKLGVPNWGPLLAPGKCRHPPHGDGSHLGDPGDPKSVQGSLGGGY